LTELGRAALVLTLTVACASAVFADVVVRNAYEARDAAWQLGALQWCETRSDDEAAKSRYAKARRFVAGVVAKAVRDGHLSQEAAADFTKGVAENAVLDGEPLDERRCEELAQDLAVPEPPSAGSPDPKEETPDDSGAAPRAASPSEAEPSGSNPPSG